MQDNNSNPLPRLTIKVSGASGQGINSVGEVIAKSLKEAGFYTFGYREYPSLIKGGYSSHQVDFSDQPLLAPSEKCDIMITLGRAALHQYLPSLDTNGILIHCLPHLNFNAAEQKFITDNNINIIEVPAQEIAVKVGGLAVMTNVVLVGMLWQMLGIELAPIEEIIRKEFAKKPKVIDANIACLQAGYTNAEPVLPKVSISFVPNIALVNDALISGNEAIGLGAITAGVRAYFAYPMTPSSSLLSYLSNVYHESGMLVKQLEDEISVAQATIGAMFMGTRALTGTAGGGFDLMAETVSLSGMTETPFVCIIAQRPGPATGLPTWTSAADLNIAVYSGHGEYTRLVIAASDIETCYTMIQHAFNYAEEFQIPVLVLTEKQIAESLFQVADLPPAVPIQRHLLSNEEAQKVTPHDRFKITESGISARWLPGQSPATYNGNSDEHLEDGSLTEEAATSKAMYDKRIRKEKLLLDKLPQPTLLGFEAAATVFVGWGSVKNTVIDCMIEWNKHNPQAQIAYLHYDYVWPLKTDAFNELVQQQKRLILIEQNAYGQLGNLITQSTGYLFKEKILKYDGRPFFVEEVWAELEKVHTS